MLYRFFYLFLLISSSDVYSLIAEDAEKSFYEKILVAKKAKKVELHIHLGGAIPLPYLETIATKESFNRLQEDIDELDSCDTDYENSFKPFVSMQQIVKRDEHIAQGTYELLKQFSEDGVNYVELRTGLRDQGDGLESYLKSVLKGIEKANRESLIEAKLILSLRRDTPQPLAEKIVDLAVQYKGQIVGIDISGDSTKGDVKQIFPALLKAKASGFPITLHIGESPKEDPENQILELKTLEPKRVGHAVYLTKEASNYIKEHKILVEMCLTSALKTGMIKEIKDHPGIQLLLQGHPVAICTDDPTIFKTNLSREYALLSEVTGLKIEDILKLTEKNEEYYFNKVLQYSVLN